MLATGCSRSGHHPVPPWRRERLPNAVQSPPRQAALSFSSPRPRQARPCTPGPFVDFVSPLIGCIVHDSSVLCTSSVFMTCSCDMTSVVALARRPWERMRSLDQARRRGEREAPRGSPARNETADSVGQQTSGLAARARAAASVTEPTHGRTAPVQCSGVAPGKSHAESDTAGSASSLRGRCLALPCRPGSSGTRAAAGRGW